MTSKLATGVDVLARALADFNVVACSEFKLKPEQEVPVKWLLDGKDVLVVSPEAVFQYCCSIGDYRFCRIIEQFSEPLQYKINTFN